MNRLRDRQKLNRLTWQHVIECLFFYFSNYPILFWHVFPYFLAFLLHNWKQKPGDRPLLLSSKSLHPDKFYTISRFHARLFLIQITNIKKFSFQAPHISFVFNKKSNKIPSSLPPSLSIFASCSFTLFLSFHLSFNCFQIITYSDTD